MACRECKGNPVIMVSGNGFCKRHFIHYFERRVLKTIRDFGLIKKGQKVGAACSGGKDSLSLLSILNDISRGGKFFRLTAIGVDEGIGGYRKKTLAGLRAFCKKEKIPLKIYSFKQEFGMDLDGIVRKTGERPCSVCGVLRRRVLNQKARGLGLDLVAVAHNMDDEIQSILMNQFRRNVRALARMGPSPGIVKSRKFVKRIKPLYFVREKEVASYAFLKGRISLRDFINQVESRHPGVKNNTVNSFLEMLPCLRQAYKGKGIQACRRCGEACSQGECMACKILGKMPGKNIKKRGKKAYGQENPHSNGIPAGPDCSGTGSAPFSGPGSGGVLLLWGRVPKLRPGRACNRGAGGQIPPGGLP
jgi:tRNA(Ile)-lysidine synthase TilS/MesJ